MASQGSVASADVDFGAFLDETDDLPRTFRREKEARAREAGERAARERAKPPSLPTSIAANSRQPRIYASTGNNRRGDENRLAATVRSFDVPFTHLVTFFLKAALAAIPALLLLEAILWFAGAGLHALSQQLIKMMGLIGF